MLQGILTKAGRRVQCLLHQSTRAGGMRTLLNTSNSYIPNPHHPATQWDSRRKGISLMDMDHKLYKARTRTIADQLKCRVITQGAKLSSLSALIS